MGDIPHELLQRDSYMGPRFTGVFFFENVFWRVVIPLVYGTARIDLMNGLAVMPAETKQHLVSNPKAREEYLLFWVDCYDYDAGFQELEMSVERSSFLSRMVQSLDRELRSTITDLSQQYPNSNAMFSARNCTEKALKALLCHSDKMTPEHAKSKFGHRLDKLIAEICRLHPNSELGALNAQLDAFAPYEDRYSDRVFSRPELWRAYRQAQFASAEVMRSITGTSHRAEIQSMIAA